MKNCKSWRPSISPFIHYLFDAIWQMWAEVGKQNFSKVPKMVRKVKTSKKKSFMLPWEHTYCWLNVCKIWHHRTRISLSSAHSTWPTCTWSSYSALKSTPRTIKVGFYRTREKIVKRNIWLASFSAHYDSKNDEKKLKNGLRHRIQREKLPLERLWLVSRQKK